ncbi:MAG: phosphatase [Lachnospiraceae bacterium]
MKKLILDTHSHTVASGHAYGTVLEMAKAASEAGLELLAITDHGPKMPGGPDSMYFCNFKVIDPVLYGVEILMGVELNIIDYRGTVDLDLALLKKMKLCIASLHTVCLTPGTKAENTRALLRAMENPYVNIMGHIDDGHYPMDFEAVIRGAREAGVLIEINNSSLVPGADGSMPKKIFRRSCVYVNSTGRRWWSTPIPISRLRSENSMRRWQSWSLSGSRRSWWSIPIKKS